MRKEDHFDRPPGPLGGLWSLWYLDLVKVVKRELGGFRKGGFNALFRDGSVRFLSETADKNLLRALITSNGGELVPPEPGIDPP